MTGFGDFDPADAYDPSPADPEQVARRLHRLRVGHGLEAGYAWEDLTGAQRAARVAVVVALLAWLRRSGAAR